MHNMASVPSIRASAPVSSPLQRESLTERSARAIREAILDGTYKLGQKLTEAELVSRFGVSSSVIREAFHVLQGEGIVVAKPYCGRSVFSVKPEEGAELTVMRASLESYAAYLAARKLTPEWADAIVAAAHRFIASPPGNYSAWVDRELGFHRTVWEAGQNEWLVRQLSQFSMPIFALRIRQRDFDVAALWENSQLREVDDNPEGHQLLASAIVSGDGPLARKTMIAHILLRSDETGKELFQFE